MRGGATLQVHPLIIILAAHGQTVLILIIIWLPLVPLCEGESLSAVPPPLTFSEVVSPSQPVRGVNTLAINHRKPVLHQVVLLLADQLCRVPVVGVAAGHGLKPGHAVVVVTRVEEAVAVVIVPEPHVALGSVHPGYPAIVG